jgi:hypothetical protein
MAKQKKEKVIIIVQGGVADVFQKSKNVEVEIRDYDIDGTEEDRLQKDKDGDEYIAAIY